MHTRPRRAADPERWNRVISDAGKEAVTPLLVALDREVDREINSCTIAGDDA
jgi:hypothetical protein